MLAGPSGAGFGQLFLVVAGSWVSGDDGVRRPLGTGQGAFIGRGEVRAKGSDTGLMAVMVQLTDLAAARAGPLGPSVVRALATDVTQL